MSADMRITEYSGFFTVICAPCAARVSTSPATADVQAVIAAAQNPDGSAIPQGPGPNGECPQVLVLLGFWSCPQIGHFGSQS